MTIAAVMTVRNEEKLLRSNLLYHHFLGVDHFFIYADRCEDGTITSVSDLPFVEILPVTSPGTLESYPNTERLLARIQAQPTRFGPRIAANAFHATTEARRRGWDWLLHIDADELVCIDSKVQRSGQLRDYLESITHDVAVVRFRTFEVCQRRRHYDNVFAEETLFKSPEYAPNRKLDQMIRFLSILARRCLRNRFSIDPVLARLRSLIGRIQGTRRPRRILDARSGQFIDVPLFYGHFLGKSAARLSADLIPSSCHDFVHRNGDNPSEQSADYLLHYIAYSFENFAARAQIRPDFLPISQIFTLPSVLFIDVANRSGLTLDELRKYYEDCVLFTSNEVASLRQFGASFNRSGRKVVEITGPKETFKSLRNRGVIGARALSNAAA